MGTDDARSVWYDAVSQYLRGDFILGELEYTIAQYRELSICDMDERATRYFSRESVGWLLAIF